MNTADILKTAYSLERHPEGGWFAEVYTSPFQQDGRPLAGSIYFLLDRDEISHFHQIDCDEIWYFHEGCGMRITLLLNGEKQELLLGNNLAAGQRAMALMPKGALFAAENIDRKGYTFVSCATAPAFRYSGFRLIGRQELQEQFPEFADGMLHLAYGDTRE